MFSYYTHFFQSADVAFSADLYNIKSNSCMTTSTSIFPLNLPKFKSFFNHPKFTGQFLILILTNLSSYYQPKFVVFYFQKQFYKKFIFFRRFAPSNCSFRHKMLQKNRINTRFSHMLYDNKNFPSQLIWIDYFAIIYLYKFV